MHFVDGLIPPYYNSLFQSCCNTKIIPWFDILRVEYHYFYIIRKLFIISKTSDVSIPLKISNCMFVKHRASYITFNRIQFVSSMHDILNSDILKVILHIKMKTNEWNVSSQIVRKIFVWKLAFFLNILFQIYKINQIIILYKNVQPDRYIRYLVIL